MPILYIGHTVLKGLQGVKPAIHFQIFLWLGMCGILPALSHTSLLLRI